MAAPEVLILGGTAEAAELARLLAAEGAFAPITSLAGLTARPAVTVDRRGSFGGAAGLAEFLRTRRLVAVVDATHPFAARMSTHAALASEATGVPLLRLERPAWRPRPDDRWVEVPDLGAAAELVRDLDARVFLPLGAAHLDVFARLRRPWFVARMVDRPRRRPFPRGQVIVARGPFTRVGELGLLRRHRIDLMIARNSGGSATYAKVAAARCLGVPVLMVQRPCLPLIGTVTGALQARAWLNTLIR